MRSPPYYLFGVGGSPATAGGRRAMLALVGWSGDQHRTADRRFTAALEATSGGWGSSLYVHGRYLVFDTLSARELGSVSYAWGGDDTVSRFELDVERGADGAERVVARTIVLHDDGTDEVHATSVLEVPTGPDTATAPPAEPCLVFEIEDRPVTREQLVLAVDALRGRLALSPELRGRDPRWVRAVGERIVVELHGADEASVLAELALDRPAVLAMPPLDVLVEGTNPYSPADLLQLDLRLACDGPLPETIEARVDGRLLDTIPRERIRPGRTSANLRDVPAEHPHHVRLLPYPLRARLRRVDAPGGAGAGGVVSARRVL